MARTLSRHFAGYAGFTKISQVVTSLQKVRDDPDAPAGIAAFTTLYEIITRDVGRTVDGGGEWSFEDPAFLTELDLQFARRYFAAIEAWEAGSATGRTTPACWAILFDSRGAPGPANFAACGVNAHVNYDLSFALLETWLTHPPSKEQRRDYNRVNDIFKTRMDRLREIFPTLGAQIGEDGGPVDEFLNFASGVLVVYTRSQAWESAADAWDHRKKGEPDGGSGYVEACVRLNQHLDASAHRYGQWLLELKRVP